MSPKPLTDALQAQGLSVHLGPKTAQNEVLHSVSLNIPAARWTSVVGPNGAGKSTLLKCLAGLLPFQGSVLWDDRPLATWTAKSRALHLAWLGQNQEGAPDLRVWDVVMLGRLPHQGWLSHESDQDSAEVEQALRATQAWDWRERALGQLSAGERQRVLLARALAVQAAVLLMDEPLANLDPPHQMDWLHLVRSLVAQGRTVVSVLHEIPMALCADELVVMKEGRVVHQGQTADPKTHLALEAVFEDRIQVRSVQGQWVTLAKP